MLRKSIMFNGDFKKAFLLGQEKTLNENSIIEHIMQSNCVKSKTKFIGLLTSRLK